MRYLAVDFGAKRIGQAICDPNETIVSPLPRIDRKSDAQAAEAIARSADLEQADAVVVGLPINMDDTEGPQAKRVRQFAELLAPKLTCPLLFQNEQLSSFAADERLSAGEFTRGKHKARQDSQAAVVILEDFLRQKNA